MFRVAVPLSYHQWMVLHFFSVIALHIVLGWVKWWVVGGGTEHSLIFLIKVLRCSHHVSSTLATLAITSAIDRLSQTCAAVKDRSVPQQTDQIVPQV